MRPHTRFLIKILDGMELNKCAEIGVFKGDNAHDLLASHLGIETLIGVDPYMRYPDFDDNLNNPHGVVAKADLKSVREYMLNRMFKFGTRFLLLEDFSENAATRFPGDYFDLVFIDGNHAYPYVYGDIKAWLPKVKKGGILAGHDYVDKPKYGVIQAVTELIPNHKVSRPAKVWWARL